jgi:hypothetical protein
MAIHAFVPGGNQHPSEDPPIRRNTRRADAPMFTRTHDEPVPGMVTDEQLGRGPAAGPEIALPPPVPPDPQQPHSRPHSRPPATE